MATTKLLKIGIHPSLANTLEISDLRSAGHEITMLPALAELDLVFAPNAWRMYPALLRYVNVAIAASRKAKYADVPVAKPSKPKRKSRKKAELNTQLDGGSSDDTDHTTPATPALYPPA